MPTSGLDNCKIMVEDPETRATWVACPGDPWLATMLEAGWEVLRIWREIPA